MKRYNNEKRKIMSRKLPTDKPPAPRNETVSLFFFSHCYIVSYTSSIIFRAAAAPDRVKNKSPCHESRNYCLRKPAPPLRAMGQVSKFTSRCLPAGNGYLQITVPAAELVYHLFFRIRTMQCNMIRELKKASHIRCLHLLQFMGRGVFL